MWNYIREHLKQALEYCLFIPPKDQNTHRKHTLYDVIISYLAPLILLPYGIYGIYLTTQTEMSSLSGLHDIQNISFPLLIIFIFIQSIVLMVLGITIMYLFTKWLERKEHFYHYLVIANWTTFPFLILSIPSFLMMQFGTHDDTAIYLVACLYMLYSYAVNVFVTSYTLNIPWEIGFGIATLFLFIHETANKVLNFVGGTYAG